MLNLALLFAIIALVAGLFGFEVVASGFAEVAMVLFFVFLVLFVLSLIAGAFRRPVA